MAKQINVGVGGVVNKVSKPTFSVGGVVKIAKKGVCGIGGVVKEFFSGDDLVLWNGSEVQNGATASQYITSISYQFTEGSLNDKQIILKVKKKCTNSHVRIYTYNGSTMLSMNATNSNGSAYTTSTGGSTWDTDREYIFDFSKLTGYDTANNIGMSFWQDLESEVGNAATKLNVTVAYIAIR